MWESPLCTMITINEYTNCFGPIDRAELMEVGKTKLNTDRKKDGIRRYHGSPARGRHAETLMEGHNLVVLYRLIKIG